MPAAAPPRPPRASAQAAPSRPREGSGVLPAPLAVEGRIRWDRVGRLALLALLAVVLLLYIAPLRNWLAQSQAADRQQNELRALERERDRLATRARDLRQDATLEREARRLGMIKRGERAYVIQGAGGSAAGATDTPARADRVRPEYAGPAAEASRDITAIEYAIDNALFQWEDGERRVRDHGELERPALAVLEELRRRLGSTFSLEELTSLYGANTDWASDVARSAGAGTEAAHVVDAAFGRYAREAVDYRAARRALR